MNVTDFCELKAPKYSTYNSVFEDRFLSHKGVKPVDTETFSCGYGGMLPDPVTLKSVPARL